MAELTMAADNCNLHKAIDFVTDELESARFPMKQILQIQLAAEEIFTNIAQYAYPDGAGDVTIRCAAGQAGVVLTFIDGGIPYDPLRGEAPAMSSNAEEREIGGLGVYMAKKIMDRIEYYHKAEKNILTMTKGRMMMKITKNEAENKLMLSLEGRLDTTTSPQLEEVLKEHIDAISELTIDLKELVYLSSAGLRVLLSSQKQMNRKNGTMIVKNVNETIMEVFEMTGFVDILTIA